MNESDLTAVLSGMVMALCHTMPPELAQRYADNLRVCAREREDAGHTNVGTLLQALAQAAELRQPPAAH